MTIEKRLTSIEAKLSVLTWMTSACLILTLLTLAGVLGIWKRLGEMSGALAQVAQHFR